MVRNIVIVGGGSAGWMTAAHLAKYLQGVGIALVESPDVPVVGVGESTVPPIVEFMKSLGLEEKDWMPVCNAVYKSSICFQGFHDKNDPPFWYPFNRTWTVAQRAANRYWLYKHLTDPDFSDRFTLYDYCTLVPEICRAGKTVRSVQGSGYAYHFDAALLGEYLKGYSTERGVQYIPDKITRVVMNDDGSIKELQLAHGEPVAGDLFVDCSGFRSILLGQELKEPFNEYYDHLFNDSAIAMRIPYIDKEREMQSFTNCTALSSGWVWNIPLYNRIGTGYVYSSKHLSRDKAEQEFRNHLGADRVKNESAMHINIRVGKHARTWVKNCVGIGLSSGFIEPLESTGIQIVHSAAHLLTTILKGRNDYTCADVAVYNSSITQLLELIRDFLVCHYALTRREDTPYWRDVKYTTKIPEALVDKLISARVNMPARGTEQNFDTGGMLAGFGFNEGWYNILTGMNYLPFDFDKHRANKIGSYEQHLEDHLAEADKVYEQLNIQRQHIQSMPSHYQFLKENIYGGQD